MTDYDSESDLDLFRRAMRDVRRMDHDRADFELRRPAPVPRKTHEDERHVMEELLSGDIEPEDLETGEELSFRRTGLQRRVLRKLRRGQYRIEAELDLHGLTVPMAHVALKDFLVECRRSDRRCVRVIHGKGRRSSNRGPVLKGKVDRWLRQWEPVLAFCSARPVDGGTGALYVLLHHHR